MVSSVQRRWNRCRKCLFYVVTLLGSYDWRLLIIRALIDAFGRFRLRYLYESPNVQQRGVTEALKQPRCPSSAKCKESPHLPRITTLRMTRLVPTITSSTHPPNLVTHPLNLDKQILRVADQVPPTSEILPDRARLKNSLHSANDIPLGRSVGGVVALAAPDQHRARVGPTSPSERLGPDLVADQHLGARDVDDVGAAGHQLVDAVVCPVGAGWGGVVAFWD
ncbi:hypothetical protein CONLIGDRAFT_703147 [Coniochaeta ligniaria NRRL 30616]|uniref:Uncharacterized protein n=1 Tax=Coniochaeta ligniaria NRRL 30616 TaxID=1408157 RepID=A0A1J7IL23_9PEZI|nr:hypothetical protein CONLIGDRAFT_703147 [Coniochaeta ligniaria NRRL 30616]